MWYDQFGTALVCFKLPVLSKPPCPERKWHSIGHNHAETSRHAHQSDKPVSFVKYSPRNKDPVRQKSHGLRPTSKCSPCEPLRSTSDCKFQEINYWKLIVQLLR